MGRIGDSPFGDEDSPVLRRLVWHRLGWWAAVVLIAVTAAGPAAAQGLKWSDWNSLNDAAVRYGSRADYELAISFAKMALKAAESGPSSAVAGHPSKDERTVMCLQTLAGLYELTGRYPEAEPVLKRAVALGEKANGAAAETLLGQTLTSLAVVDEQTGRYAEAEVAAKRAQQLIKKSEVRADNDAYMVPILNTFASLSMRDGHYDEAKQFLNRAKDILAFAGVKSVTQSPTLYLLALCDLRQDRYEEARINAAMAMLNMRDAYGPKNPRLAKYYLLLALIYFAEHKENRAEELFDQDLAILSAQFESSFAYMSERDRLRLLETVQTTFQAYFTFCVGRYSKTPEVAGRMYDALLWEKGMIAQSVGAMWAQMAALGDANERDLVAKLVELKARYAQLAENPGPDAEAWVKQMEGIRGRANDIEEQLVRNQSQHRRSPATVTWRDVQKRLGASDAAIEFARFTEYDGKSPSSKAYYVALVVVPGSANPTLVNLGAASNLEAAGLAAYREAVAKRGMTVTAAKIPGVDSYRALWQPLGPYLKAVQRVYASPDGVLDEIPLGILPDDSGKLLGEKYDLRILISTRDVLEQGVPSGHGGENTAVLIGNPQFDLTPQGERSALAKLGAKSESPAFPTSLSPLNRMRSRDPVSGKLPPLPGTQVEIEAIKRELEEAHWHAEVFLGPLALKRVLMRVRSPRLVHIATHGFFQPDQQVDAIGMDTAPFPTLEDPMLRSGLYLAGADRVLSHQPVPEDLEDGVLTAYEASTLNLHGTELVILSACETGLGKIQNGEGVFGLRRAFQLAGAHYIVMSLWSVPDRETQELMEDFLGRWLHGEEIHAALRNAQEHERALVRARYHVDAPYYWGAFILVGN